MGGRRHFAALLDVDRRLLCADARGAGHLRGLLRCTAELPEASEISIVNAVLVGPARVALRQPRPLHRGQRAALAARKTGVHPFVGIRQRTVERGE